MANSSIICIVDNNEYGDIDNIYRDMARTKVFDGTYNIGARGITYLSSKSKKEFIRGCKKYNLEFIIPNKKESKNG